LALHSEQSLGPRFRGDERIERMIKLNQ
jgi:hypothetical protein